MRYFKPKLIPTLAFLLIFPALIALGFWQLNRAQAKKSWINTLQRGQILPLNQAIASPTRAQYHKISLKGEFVSSPTILLMHQSQGGQHGVHVINLFKIDGERDFILVNRGFINNQKPQNIAPPPGQPITLHGIIDLPKSDRFILGSNILDPSLRPLPVQRLDLPELEALLNTRLLPLVILADQNLDDGLLRQWQITPSMPPEKHLGYAVQWFALALCLAVIYLSVNLKRRS
jgi:surfeit locus 1 family protein